MTTHSRRAYDHRIKQQVILTGDPDLLPELEIPPSTALSWIRRGMSNVVALDEDIEVEAALRTRIGELEHRVSMLTAVLRLVLAIVRVSSFRLERARMPDAGSKRIIINAVERARKVMSLSSRLSEVAGRRGRMKSTPALRRISAERNCIGESPECCAS